MLEIFTAVVCVVAGLVIMKGKTRCGVHQNHHLKTPYRAPE